MKEVLSVGFPTDDKRLTSGAFSISRSLAKGLAQDDRVLSVTPGPVCEAIERMAEQGWVRYLACGKNI